MSTWKSVLFVLCGVSLALITSRVQAQLSADDVEAAAGAGTYLDLTHEVAGTSRNGITMVWSNFTDGDWNFPDTSDGSDLVAGSSADDKGSASGDGTGAPPSPPIDLGFSGLLPSTEYNIFLAAIVRNPGNDEAPDISWGTDIGSLMSFEYDRDNLPLGSIPVNKADDADSRFLGLLKAGTLMSDGAGNLNFFVGTGLPWGPDVPRHRTQFDGVLLSVVPEPGSVALAMFAVAGAGLMARRRRTA